VRYARLEHRFVDRIPRLIEPGVLYISTEHGTAIHSCCCGCGHEVVTPLTPTDWKMTYDGESVSLDPSIGNWQLACHSHYIIRRGQVIEAAPWTRRRIAAEQERDKRAKTQYYAGVASAPPEAAAAPATTPDNRGAGLLAWLRRLFD
jgi:hypothetical protein